MAPALILTLNAGHLPNRNDDGLGFGVVGYSLRAARELSALKQFGGFILYERDEALQAPALAPSHLPEFPGVRLRFSFHMQKEAVRHAFSVAVRWTMEITASSHDCNADRQPILYHQSNTLLMFTPAAIPFFITHHGPFASEIVDAFGSTFAVEAFRGGPGKVSHLLRFQNHGLSVLRNARQALALEMSEVQANALRRNRIPDAKIYRLAAPIDVSRNCECRDTAMPMRDSSDRTLHIVSAASRVDPFKNLERIIAAADQLLAAGVALRVSLLVGAEDEQMARERLAAAASRKLQARLSIRQRTPHAELIRGFHQSAPRTVFVCSSRYETLCITALEAVLSGVMTLVPDEPARIGATEYMPAFCRFKPTVEGLTERLMRLCQVEDISRAGGEARAHVSSRVGVAPFLDGLQTALRRLLHV